MNSLNYYAILEVPKTATSEDIKKSYRRLAMQWHPDKNPHNIEFCTERFKSINEAYFVLKDEEKRNQYDVTLDSPGSRYSSSKMNNNDAINMFFTEMYNLALELSFINKGWTDIEKTLITEGCPLQVAKIIAQECVNYRKSTIRRAAIKPFIKSFLWFFAGGAITLSTYNSAAESGGTYLLAWGPILFGGYNMLVALKYLITGFAPK